MTETETSPLAAAVGSITSGLYIVSCGKGETSTGYLASFVQQFSFEPMVIGIGVQKDRPHIEVIRSTKSWIIHPLAASDGDSMKQFWQAPKPGSDPFGELPREKSESGLTVLTETLAYVECELIQEIDFDGDHILFLGKAVRGAKRRNEKPKAHSRKSGLSY